MEFAFLDASNYAYFKTNSFKLRVAESPGEWMIRSSWLNATTLCSC
jgi:hypothetical protein